VPRIGVEGVVGAAFIVTEAVAGDVQVEALVTVKV
jgi:hypothetical protein